jgi:hypothetical protein
MLALSLRDTSCDNTDEEGSSDQKGGAGEVVSKKRYLQSFLSHISAGKCTVDPSILSTIHVIIRHRKNKPAAMREPVA